MFSSWTKYIKTFSTCCFFTFRSIHCVITVLIILIHCSKSSILVTCQSWRTIIVGVGIIIRTILILLLIVATIISSIVIVSIIIVVHWWRRIVIISWSLIKHVIVFFCLINRLFERFVVILSFKIVNYILYIDCCTLFIDIFFYNLYIKYN